MLPANHPKIQHYVPQFLLRNFGFGEKQFIWAFRLDSQQAFTTNAKNVACEAAFYDFELDGVKQSAEHFLGSIETPSSKIISAIISGQPLAQLGLDDKNTISNFVAVQLVRGPWYRNQLADIGLWIDKMLGEEGPPGNARLREPIMSANDLSIASASAIGTFSATPSLIMSKVWFLLRCPPKHAFVVGDHPVGIYNKRPAGPYGNMGIMSPGIEIYLPLSPEITLAMYCPGHKNCSSWEPDSCRVISETSVDFLNRVQIHQAHQYVFSKAADFKLVQQVLQEKTRSPSG